MPHNGKSFIDTNILVYAAAKTNDHRHAVAVEVVSALLNANMGVVSTQVMKEFYSVASGKLALSKADAKRLTLALKRFEVVSSTIETIEQAIELTMTYSISIWDAMLVSAAKQADCERLISEDLQHGSTLSGVKIVNPFL